MAAAATTTCHVEVLALSTDWYLAVLAIHVFFERAGNTPEVLVVWQRHGPYQVALIRPEEILPLLPLQFDGVAREGMHDLDLTHARNALLAIRCSTMQVDLISYSSVPRQPMLTIALLGVTRPHA